MAAGDMDIFNDFDLSETIVFASYLPVTSASGPLPLDYSTDYTDTSPEICKNNIQSSEDSEDIWKLRLRVFLLLIRQV